MASPERPFVEVLTSIFGNVQEIVRSEFRLAKAEAREEIAAATHRAAWAGAGAVSGFFAIGFASIAAFFALEQLLPNWAAALIIAVVLAGVSAIAFQVRAAKPQAVNKEKLAWAKQPTR